MGSEYWIMITINSFLHREVLNDIIRRWMYDEARPSDADLITRLVHFNHIFAAATWISLPERSSGGFIRAPSLPVRSRSREI